MIGPHGLNLIGSGNSTLPDLGQLGLLYLMFVAGVELDLNLLRRYRRSAVAFGLLTFAVPVGARHDRRCSRSAGKPPPRSCSVRCSLRTRSSPIRPCARRAWPRIPAVATAVGSTVLTDTLALVVLAGGRRLGRGRSLGRGSRRADRRRADRADRLQPARAAALAAMGVSAGSAPSARCAMSSRSPPFLSAATVAELFGIEGIVGAFFAGLALNRLVPNEGQLMERIEFFGGAVFIPVFLVSVGLILNPSVMVEGADARARRAVHPGLPRRQGAGRDAVSARLLGFSRPQAGAAVLAELGPGRGDAGGDRDRLPARPVRQLGRQRRARA